MKTSPKSIFDSRYKQLIAELVKIRQANNWPQRKFAEIAKKDHCFIARTEICERRLDLIETIDLCKALGLNKNEILKLVEKLI
jgi:hypothetical protein